MIIIEHIHPWSWQFSLITEEAKKYMGKEKSSSGLNWH
jgi:hypothetical protein